ncbi:DUF4102 domain-containing protein [Aggregatibacter actinomycetemcomitans]|uniref:integrase arm-type DNA-binding domain-containing protein n=1 Tax=Aggregatibacter actinomycetemcomitans TaxID=714 RepID=UPI0011D5DAAE|nr:integrase arm-type DNA-binding domain-containing protein [Aggregatibacter actinomycetemcomitans]TYA51908.1 DUF4102 domain-containing protein [Aggregatibacter actinomycetemcomitans]TYB30006.1 DUF4102 domain-containing protein [Aggregatibacter actinomycetemcomitans]
MARIIKPLTDKEIRTAKADKFPLRDGNGLSLELTTTGAKIWRFNYFKPFTQKRTNTSLGKLSDITLTQARVNITKPLGRSRFIQAFKQAMKESQFAYEFEQRSKDGYLITNVYFIDSDSSLNEWQG